MSWHTAVSKLRPYVMKVATPRGSGTGWLVSRTTTTGLCAIATAAHVLDQAHFWEEPIRLHHDSSGKSVVLHHDERAILIDEALDSAAIVFDGREMPFPEDCFPLLAKDKFMKPGVEIGWLGFPAIPQSGLCFFSGRISAYIEPVSTYLVDGVAINGVSGGPAFTYFGKDSAIELIGIVSAYIPNRATGDALPGVAVVRDATQFHDVSEGFRSIDEAKAKETLPPEPVQPEQAALATKF